MLRESGRYNWFFNPLVVLEFECRKDPEFSDRQLLANSADPDQTAPRGAI